MKVPLPRVWKRVWVPKNAPPPSLVGSDHSSSCSATSDIQIAWNSIEKTWVHKVTQFQYSPRTDTHFNFVSDLDGV